MKKSTILIAFLAVMSATSAARAEEFNMNFDGKLGAQSMHSIFTAGHNLVPASVSQEPKAQAVEGAPKAVRFMSHKAKLAQLEVLKNINAKVIRNEKLTSLLEAQGTEIWFYENTVSIINADMNGRFTIRDEKMFRAVYNAQSKTRFDPVDLLVIGIVEVAHNITNGIQEYGSWPPVPDNGMANYDPVTGNDFTPGWGRAKKQ